MAPRAEADLLRGIAGDVAGRIAQGGMRPERFTGLGADPESHQGRAIIQVSADPIPAGGVFIEHRGGPFMVQPAAALDSDRLACLCDAASHLKLGFSKDASSAAKS